jgi:hypothetical protein
VAKNRFLDEKEEKILFDFDDPISIAKYMQTQRRKINKLLGLDDEENEENYDVQYEYIQLVFPPGSAPPIRESIKRMTLLDISPIQHVSCGWN